MRHEIFNALQDELLPTERACFDLLDTREFIEEQGISDEIAEWLVADLALTDPIYDLHVRLLEPRDRGIANSAEARRQAADDSWRTDAKGLLEKGWRNIDIALKLHVTPAQVSKLKAKLSRKVS